MPFETVARTHVGHRRRINEDAMLARPERGLWAVADGMGGHHAGDVASQLVVEATARAAAPPDVEGLTKAVRQALLEVNGVLYAMGGDGPRRRTIGSTIVALIVDETSYSCLWAGDSRAYQLRGGDFRLITRDHSLVQQLVDAGEIEPGEAATHPNANVITRAVGADERLMIESVSSDLREGDAFILASDGLTRLASEEELRIALGSADLDAAANQLLALCLGRGAPDNITFIIVRHVSN